jgi:DNA-directed RNA polymerase specialized sigma24 family protein
MASQRWLIHHHSQSEGEMDEKEQHNPYIDPAIVRLVRFKSRHLAGKYGCARHDREDIEQILLLDYWQRFTAFDSDRCSHRGFARLIVNNRISVLIEAQRAARRDYRMGLVCLDDSPDDASTADEIPSCSFNPRAKQSLESQLHRRLDVRRMVERMPTALAQLCRLLMACDSAVEAAEMAGISRATLYRRIRRLQDVFSQGGIREKPMSRRRR